MIVYGWIVLYDVGIYRGSILVFVRLGFWSCLARWTNKVEKSFLVDI